MILGAIGLLPGPGDGFVVALAIALLCVRELRRAAAGGVAPAATWGDRAGALLLVLVTAIFAVRVLALL
jgi:hypothetical protein